MASAQDEGSATPRDRPFDKLTYIQESRDRSNYTQHAPGPIQLIIIKDLYSMTIDLWRRILLAPQISRPQDNSHNITDDCFQRLHLWGIGHGVLSGDLDSCLQNSKELYDSVMSLLMSIADLVFHGLLPSIMPIKSLEYEAFLNSDIPGFLELSRSTLSHSDARITIVNDIEDLAASLENEVECLTFLSPAITAPALDQPGNIGQALDYLANVPHHVPYMEIIRSKFPIAQNALVERLAKVSWHRYQHICQQRVTEDTKDLPNQDEVKSQFQDSGLGSSICISSRQDDAMTVMSTRAESSHKRLPSLSGEARAGEPFTCEVCYKVVIIKRTRDWREHIFRDLLAYSCIFEDCSSGAVLFENPAAISAHLISEHTTQLSQCSLCYEQFGDYNSSVLLHFTRHMEEIALAALPPIATSDVESDYNTDSEESLSATKKKQAVPRSHTSGSPTPSLASWKEAQSVEKREDIIINTELSHDTESTAQSATTSFVDPARPAYPKAPGILGPPLTMELTAIEDQSGLGNLDAYSSVQVGSQGSSKAPQHRAPAPIFLPRLHPASPTAGNPTKTADKKRFQCDKGCTRTFGRAEDLGRHMRMHETPKFRCFDIDCGKEFHRLDKLHDHTKKVHGVKL